MARSVDRPGRSIAGPTETFLTSAGGSGWADVERRPVLRAELERVRDHLLEQDADYPPDDVYAGDGEVEPLLREFDRERRIAEG
jgi:hypothetical protein